MSNLNLNSYMERLVKYFESVNNNLILCDFTPESLYMTCRVLEGLGYETFSEYSFFSTAYRAVLVKHGFPVYSICNFPSKEEAECIFFGCDMVNINTLFNINPNKIVHELNGYYYKGGK